MLSIKTLAITGLFYFLRIFPIQNNKIVITVNLGQEYGDSAKYIVEALKNMGKHYDIVWLCKNPVAIFPEGIRKVSYQSLRGIYEQVTAKIWIDNRRKPLYVRKRKQQYYIMTWHGTFSMKRVEKDVADKLPPAYVKAAIKDSKMADLFLSSSRSETELYRNSFWYDGEILKCGLPRNDILLNCSEHRIRSIRKNLNIQKSECILLYAPTFRVARDKESLNVYSLDWEKTLEALHNRFGGKWRGIARMHPNIADLSENLNYPPEVIDGTNYPDMQELLVVADCLITDYSSSIFEFGLMRKPGFLFATDLDDYLNDRGFYISIHEWPFSLATNNQELADHILKFDEIVYKKDIDRFYIEKYGGYPLGNASEKVAQRIVDVIEGE